MKPIRVILFDDNHLLREAMHEIVSQSDEMEMVGSYESCDNLMHIIGTDEPDVIIMDIEMPGINGIEAVKLIKKEHPSMPILMQTVFDDNDNVYNAIASGASGYVLKNSSLEEIIQAIKNVFEGGAPLSPSVARKVLNHLQSEAIEKTDFKLSLREKEVLQYLVQGLAHKQIAGKMSITYDTVRAHMKKIYEKLHVSSMTEAVAKAIRYKLHK